MPCYDGMDALYREEQRVENKQVKDENKKLQAVICALSNELQRRGILWDVVQKAEANGKVNITSFISQHLDEDRKRVQDLLDNLVTLCVSEIDLIKSIVAWEVVKDDK